MHIHNEHQEWGLTSTSLFAWPHSHNSTITLRNTWLILNEKLQNTKRLFTNKLKNALDKQIASNWFYYVDLLHASAIDSSSTLSHWAHVVSAHTQRPASLWRNRFATCSNAKHSGVRLRLLGSHVARPTLFQPLAYICRCRWWLVSGKYNYGVTIFKISIFLEFGTSMRSAGKRFLIWKLSS